MNASLYQTDQKSSLLQREENDRFPLPRRPEVFFAAEDNEHSSYQAHKMSSLPQKT